VDGEHSTEELSGEVGGVDNRDVGEFSESFSEIEPEVLLLG